MSCRNPNCKKEVPQVKGKRKKLYCSDSCKQTYFKRKKQRKITIAVDEYEELKRKAGLFKEPAVPSGVRYLVPDQIKTEIWKPGAVEDPAKRRTGEPMMDYLIRVAKLKDKV